MTHVTQTMSDRRSTRLIVAALIIALSGALTIAVLLRLDEDRSVTARANPAPVAATAELYAPEELTLYARSHGLAGLSPASLAQQGTDPTVYEVYRDVAQYAHANGLTGLSPASLAPLARRAGE